MDQVLASIDAQPTVAPTEYFSLRDIARALGANKKTVQRTAEREAWPCRAQGNRLEFIPPAQIALAVVATPAMDTSCPAPEVRFSDLAHSDAAREKVLLRERAVKLVASNSIFGKMRAVALVVEHFKKEQPLMPISPRALHDWCAAYAERGIDGLVEQKRGVVGRKSYARDLAEESILRGRANAVEHGIKGRQNIARAFRNMVSDPTIHGSARMWLHGAHASKSYVPPSVRDALRVSPLGTKLMQIGPKAAKLDGPYTECSYADTDIRAITADDMTANCYVWCEWPNEEGFLLIRPQILAVMNVGTMAWLNIRAVMRPKGQYTKDDVWGLLGDYLDEYGLHTDTAGKVDQIAVLEGGTWQSNVVIGHKTGIDDSTRFGGLKSLGVKVIHTRTPRGKIIETAFNNLQHAADAVRGFCGRMEMKDCPENVKHELAQVRAGHAHPRQYFLHVSEYAEHLRGVMNALNHERNDGKILHGRTPAEAWAEINPTFVKFPDESKWMYRAAYNVLQVTRNGVRVTIGSGKFQKGYTYSHPALEIHRGRRVVIFWNDYDPDTDAVIYTLKSGKPDKLICCAPRVPELSRFGATTDQLATEAQRKKLLATVSRTESRTLAPFLERRTGGASVPASGPVGEQITRARENTRATKRTQANARRLVGSADELLDSPAQAEPQDNRCQALSESSEELLGRENEFSGRQMTPELNTEELLD